MTEIHGLMGAAQAITPFWKGRRPRTGELWPGYSQDVGMTREPRIPGKFKDLGERGLTNKVNRPNREPEI